MIEALVAITVGLAAIAFFALLPLFCIGAACVAVVKHMNIGAWRVKTFWQRPVIGGRWYRGNFTLGLAVDSHPRFVNVLLCFVVVEVGVAVWKETD